MNKKIVTFVSIVLTVFILGTAGLVFKEVSANNSSEIPPEVQQQILQREQEYQTAITEANQRIEQLNNELVVIQEEQATEPQINSVDTVVENAALTSSITPEEAALLALEATGYQDPILALPELVDFEGQVAYEVQLQNGVVYLNAQSGAVLFNGVPHKIDNQQAAVIAAEYLGGMDPRYAVVKQSLLNGSEVLQVTLHDYVVFMDPFGNVLQAQYTQYDVSSSSTNNTSSTSSNSSSYDDDHDENHSEDHDDDD